MPLQPKQLSPTEVIAAREAAQPTIATSLDLLLRGGAACYLEFECALLKACEVAYTTSRFTGPDGRTRFERRKYTRVNPEDMKRALQSCGVLLSTEEYRCIRVAYSDPVGFVLSDAFLSAICPIGQVPKELARMLLSALPADAPPASPADAEGLVTLPDVYLDDVLQVLAVVFAAPAENSEASEDCPAAAAAASSLFNTNAYEEALRCFSAERYPTQRVSCLSVVNFIAAELLLLYSNAAVSDGVFTSIVTSLEQRLADCAGQLQPAPPMTAQEKSLATSSSTATTASGKMSYPPSAAALAAATMNTDKTSSIVDFSMTHTNVPRRPHKFEYYMQHDDRRDEWLRGRQEKDARGMYMRHTVGYAGHLPEFQYHFGRTFHVIEEDLPDLTRPKAPLEPLAADAFGPGRALKNTQMTEHHFTFA